VLNQESHPIAFFSEKLKEKKQRYDLYDHEFYAIVQHLRHWRHYMLRAEFILYSDHQALRYLNWQKQVGYRHIKWLEFIQEYTFVLKRCACMDNKAADALSRKLCTLQSLHA